MRVESWEEVVVAWYERRIVLQAGVLFVIEDALIHEPQPHPAHSKSVPPGGGLPMTVTLTGPTRENSCASF